MNTLYSKKVFLLMAGTVIAGLCSLGILTLFGSGLALWLTSGNTEFSSTLPTQRPINVVRLPPTATNTAIPTATSTPSPTATAVSSPTPTFTPTPTPTQPPPPTDTPLPPPTDTPTLLPPSPTPLPTDTPMPPPPAYPFVIAETAKYDTNHLNFDVYIAVTNSDNKPLNNYRVIGTHSSGLQIESQMSAGDWTQNSGAMHYKAGNIKYEAFNSPSGVWTLQLVDAEGTPVAEPIAFPFEASSPTWYFLLYRLE